MSQRDFHRVPDSMPRQISLSHLIIVWMIEINHRLLEADVWMMETNHCRTGSRTANLSYQLCTSYDPQHHSIIIQLITPIVHRAPSTDFQFHQQSPQHRSKSARFRSRVESWVNRRRAETTSNTFPVKSRTTRRVYI